MARTKGTYSLPANIEVLAGAPLDARDRVATKADLTTSGTFPYPYVGMETFVVSEGKKYRLISENPTVLDNWEELGSGILEGAKTVTGNPITLTDGSDSYAEDLSVTIEPAQDLHGYDHPWVGGAGKNKLHVTMGSSTIGTFSMIVNSDGSVTFDGTAQSDIQNVLADEYPTSNITIPSGTYKLNGGIAGVTIRVYADDALIYMGSATSDAEFTIPSGISSSYVSIDIASGSIFSNVTMYPMVRLSTVTDGTFEPWENICPISGHTECEVDDCGKNLFDATKAINTRTAVSDSNITLTTTGNFQGSNAVLINNVKYSKTYVVSGTIPTGCGVEVRFFDNDGNTTETTITLTTSGSSFTVGNINTKSVTLTLGNRTAGAGTFVFKNIQLEIGAVPTFYEPYNLSNATIQFGQTVYGGTVDFTTGVLTINSGYVEFDGSNDENWWKYGQGSASAYCMVTSVSNLGKLVKCNELQIIPSNATWGNYDAFITKEGTGLYTGVRSITTSADWKTYLSNNPLQVVYELATPIIIELTPTDLKLLKGTNSLTSNGTTINLKYWPDTVLGDVLAASEAYTDRNKGEGGGSGAVKGYYKTADGKFYEESTYTTEITPDASLLYLDLSTENLYDCDGTNYTLVTTDEKVTSEVIGPTSETDYYISLVKNTGNQKPKLNWSFKIFLKKGTTSALGYNYFVLGNNIASGTDDNQYGLLRIYSQTAYKGDITVATNLSANRAYTLPDKSGTIALTSDLTDEKVTGQVQNPTSGTTYNVPFIGTTNQKPYYNNGFQYTTLEGTTSAGGYSQLVLGNSTSTGTAGNKRGSLVLYSEKNGNVTLRATGASTNGRDIYFPDKAGTVALTSDLVNTVPSAYCSTAAGTAAKTATCTSFVLNSNSYIHVLIANSNTSASALTLNINGTGAKTIYINGSVSSSSNYTLPAGTYIVRYDGTYYYFRTDGRLTASITGTADSATKVYQSSPGSSGYSNWRPLLVSDANSATEGFSPSNITGSTYIFNTLSCQPSTGTIRASIYKFNSDASVKYNSTTKSIDFVFA